MINKRQTISLFEKPLFSLLDFNTPITERLPIPATACFSYIIEADNQVINKNAGIIVSKGNVILSLCGITLGSVLSQQEAGNIKSLIVHFFLEHLQVVFKGSKPEGWVELDSPSTKYLAQTAANNLLKGYVQGIQSLFDNQDAVTNELLVLKLKELVTLLFLTENSPEILKIAKSLFSEKEFSFKETIDAHLFEPLSIEDLATITNRSLTTFKRDFKNIYGDTPNRYIITKRTEEVAKRIIISDLPISQIGYECGFSSPSHLSRCFKTKYNISPSEFRENFSGKKLDF